MDADAIDVVLHDPDLLFRVFELIDHPSLLKFALRHDANLDTLRCVLVTSHTWRAAALRPDLLHWSTANMAAFLAVDSLSARRTWTGGVLASLGAMSIQASLTRWDCSTVSKLLACKRVHTLSLDHVRVAGASAAAQLAAALPSTSLHTLILSTSAQQPDVMLHALLERLESLPQLHTLDIRGVLTERTFAGVRLLQLRDPGGSIQLVRTLPSLERLAVGFHTFTAIGIREGQSYLSEQMSRARAPRLQSVGCMFGVDRLVPIDIHCRLCQTQLYCRLTRYLVHPPQQPHIS